MAGWLPITLMALIGLAHALASWVYFARTAGEWWWLWTFAWILATVSCMIAASTNPWLAYGLFTGIVALWTVWWVVIRASAAREWVPENRYQATGTLVGDTLMVRHVRNFHWKSKQEVEEHWETRAYDLSRLEALDLYVCTWGDPKIAHIMVSFDFAGRPPLCFSIETRREVGERWSALAGFMKSYELLFIAGDERDLVRSRVNLRGEVVRLYRIAATAETRKRILRRTIAQMNRLAERPRFYNTVFHNCTVEIARIVWAGGQRFPLDWRILVSGYVAEYLYDIELLDRSRPFATLKQNADIRDRSRAADADPAYSRRIRADLADPNVPAATARTAEATGRGARSGSG